MRRTLAGLLAALAGFTPAFADSAAPSAKGTRIGELIGLEPSAVKERLADAPAVWPIRPALELQTPQGVLSFVTLGDLLLDPIMAEMRVRWETRGDLIATPAHLECREHLGDGVEPMLASEAVLAFRNHRLEAVYGPVRPQPARTQPSPRAMEDAKALMLQPRTSALIARPGDLPLADEAGFMTRWDRALLPRTAVISASCAPWTPPPPRLPTHRSGGLTASDLQGLSLLPFAITLPTTNFKREESRKRGSAVLASLQVGAPLGASAQQFAHDHPGVAIAWGSSADYAVMTIDLGGYPTRNLSNFRDFALVGVRDGRVAWIAPTTTTAPVTVGLSPSLLCLSPRGVPGRVRPGCSTYGFYAP